MPSLTARALQFLMRSALRGSMARDEATLRRGLPAGRRTGAGDPPASLFKRFDVTVERRDEHRVFTVRPRGGRPVFGQVFYLPGGGYVNPPALPHWWFIARLVKSLGVACTVVRYPLAPEHPCEVGLAFAGGAYRRVVAEHGADKVVVMGDSAGGGLALAMLQQTGVAPAGLVLDAPWLDASVCDPSQIEIERGEWLLDRFTLRTWGTWWAGGRDLRDPLVSPLFGDLSGLPPTLVLCGSADILVADARRLAAAAPDRVTYVEEVGLMHVYPLLPFLPEARRAWTQIAAFTLGRLAGDDHTTRP